MRLLIWQEQNQMKGGAESWITDLAAALRLGGHSVAWLYSPQIKPALDTFKPDVVILGTIHNFVGLQYAEWLAEQRVPGVWMLHDYWPFCGPRMLMREHNRSDRNCEAAGDVCRNSCGAWHAIPAVLGRFYTVTGCEGAAAIMRRNGLRVDAVVEEGIDTEVFKPAAKNVGGIVLASAAWNAPWKGMHLLQQATEKAGLRMRLLSGMPREQVAAELARARLFAFPSVYQEIWGLALTEAMACGCACVAFDVSGARDQIHAGLGYIVPSHDVRAMGDAFEWLNSHPYDVKWLGERAREHVEREHSLEAVGKRWDAVLKRVTAGVSACAI